MAQFVWEPTTKQAKQCKTKSTVLNSYIWQRTNSISQDLHHTEWVNLSPAHEWSTLSRRPVAPRGRRERVGGLWPGGWPIAVSGWWPYLLVVPPTLAVCGEGRSWNTSGPKGSLWCRKTRGRSDRWRESRSTLLRKSINHQRRRHRQQHGHSRAFRLSWEGYREHDEDCHIVVWIWSKHGGQSMSYLSEYMAETGIKAT